jgi:hypothetical protein
MTDSMNLNITNLKYEQNEVGRLIKGSKMIYTWEFVLDGNRRKVELVHSRITGKRRILLDGKVVTKAQRYTLEFQYSFLIEKHYVILIQTAPDNYELRIDNISFSSLINKEKINNFDKMKKENNFDNFYSRGGADPSDIRTNQVAKEIHKIEDDFFTKNENKFSAETKFQEKNYFDNSDWNFDGKGESKKKLEGPNFFNDQDFDFNKKTELNTGNLLIVNKNKKTGESNVSHPVQTNQFAPKNSKEQPQQPQQKNLLDFNDIFSNNTNNSSVPTTAPVNQTNNKNDLFNLFDVGAPSSNNNANFSNLTNNNVNLMAGNQQSNVLKVKNSRKIYIFIFRRTII